MKHLTFILGHLLARYGKAGVPRFPYSDCVYLRGSKNDGDLNITIKKMVTLKQLVENLKNILNLKRLLTENMMAAI